VLDLEPERVFPITSAALLIAAVVAFPQGIGGVYRRVGELADGIARRAGSRGSEEIAVTDVKNAATLRAVPRPIGLRVPTTALLQVKDLRVTYGGILAIADLSLEVRAGEIVGLIGANGAGKTTFFNAVSGLAPAAGSITYRNVELVGLAPVRRSSLGIARTFQDVGLMRSESVNANVLLTQTWLASTPAAASLLGLGTSLREERELRRRADLALRLFGLQHLAGTNVGELPYGTARLVEIAAAVAAGPDLLLLDEATAGLGPEESLALGESFLALRDELGLTLLVIEHHVPFVARVCDYTYCLESGVLIAEGPPAEVTAQPDVIASFLGRRAAATGGTA
jgi:branched-chain amino acid transport system ATP-binding protein